MYNTYLSNEINAKHELSEVTKSLVINIINSHDFTKLNNCTNGNPRYAIHFLQIPNFYDKSQNYDTSIKYNNALTEAKKSSISFKKYHNKSYGGGLSFSSYSVESELSEAFQEIIINQFKDLILDRIETKGIEAKTRKKQIKELKQIFLIESYGDNIYKRAHDWMTGLGLTLPFESFEIDRLLFDTYLLDRNLFESSDCFYWNTLTLALIDLFDEVK